MITYSINVHPVVALMFSRTGTNVLPLRDEGSDKPSATIEPHRIMVPRLPTRIWTRAAGLKVRCHNHYTTAANDYSLSLKHFAIAGKRISHTLAYLSTPEHTWTHLNTPEHTWTHLNTPEHTVHPVYFRSKGRERSWRRGWSCRRGCVWDWRWWRSLDWPLPRRRRCWTGGPFGC